MGATARNERKGWKGRMRGKAKRAWKEKGMKIERKRDKEDKQEVSES